MSDALIDRLVSIMAVRLGWVLTVDDFMFQCELDLVEDLT